MGKRKGHWGGSRETGEEPGRGGPRSQSEDSALPAAGIGSHPWSVQSELLSLPNTYFFLESFPSAWRQERAAEVLSRTTDVRLQARTASSPKLECQQLSKPMDFAAKWLASSWWQN